MLNQMRSLDPSAFLESLYHDAHENVEVLIEAPACEPVIVANRRSSGRFLNQYRILDRFLKSIHEVGHFRVAGQDVIPSRHVKYNLAAKRV
jgi:hypothetical protein